MFNVNTRRFINYKKTNEKEIDPRNVNSSSTVYGNRVGREMETRDGKVGVRDRTEGESNMKILK